MFHDVEPPQPSLVWRLRWLGTALAAFLVVAAGFRAGLAALGHGPRSSGLDAKWRQFEARADETDVLFLGTSRVQRHLDPRRMRAVWRRRGLDMRSYNLGLPRMNILEADEILKRLSARRPRRLKAVVLEPTLYLFDVDNWYGERDMASHDWYGTCLAVRNTLAGERRRGSGRCQRLRFAWPHVMSFFCRSVNLGSAVRLVFPRAAARAAPAGADAHDELAGYVPLPASSPADGVAGPGDWRRRFTRFLTDDADPHWGGAPLSDEESAYFDDVIARVRDLGAEPVFLLGPRVKRDSHTAAVLRSHAQRYGDVLLLDYLRGRGCDEIYRLDLWHDFDHLNADGAALLSRQVAGDLTTLLRPAAPAALVPRNAGHVVR
ncbi:MAG TPA: hypothetical protein VMV69_26630 [Pirellulales bacterium]|nr:hypothetical protein [Pirellulales bacterium]